MDNKDRKRIMESCLILMEECYNNDSDTVKLEFKVDDYIVKCSFDYSIYVEEE